MRKLSIEHQGRELLHVMGLLTRCLGIPGSTTATRDRWGRDLAAARRKLEALHARGLRRDLAPGVSPPPTPARPGRPSRRGPIRPSGDAETALMAWQQELVVRLERGLGRSLGPEDASCIAWNLSAETMTVATQPLLDELRANNLTSNVFRTGASPAAEKRGR